MPIKRQPSALALALERRKREALAEAHGRCECPIEKHEWHQGMVCGRELHDSYYYLRGKNIASGIMVVCYDCHCKISSSHERVY